MSVNGPQTETIVYSQSTGFDSHAAMGPDGKYTIVRDGHYQVAMRKFYKAGDVIENVIGLHSLSGDDEFVKGQKLQVLRKIGT